LWQYTRNIRPCNCVRTCVEDAGNGPFPTILFNHGSGKSYTREVEAVGPAYASHGFAFFAPSRRGQWLSAATGQYILDSLDATEKLKGKEARDPLLVELMKGPQLADVRAALAFIKTKPFVQPDRVVVAGNSFGTSTPEGHSFGYFGGATWGPEVVAFVKSPPRR